MVSRFGHLEFEDLNLFRISDFVLGIWASGGGGRSGAESKEVVGAGQFSRDKLLDGRDMIPSYGVVVGLAQRAGGVLGVIGLCER